MNCLYSSSSCTSSYHSDAAVTCGGDIAGIKVEIIISIFSSQQLVVLIMVIFVWLVPVVPTQLKEEWSTAVMECGEPLVAQSLIQEMVKWCVDNLDTRIHVSLIFKITHFDLIINSGVKLFSSNKFGIGTGPVVFTGLSCTGNEQSILNCPHSSNSYHSSHSSDIGIRCLLKG